MRLHLLNFIKQVLENLVKSYQFRSNKYFLNIFNPKT